jgi:hypothetical protein
MAETFVFWYTLAQCFSRIYVFIKSVIALHMSKDSQAFLLEAQGKMVDEAQLPSVLWTAC